MATTEFVAVNWNPNQVIDEDSLDQMNNNINWLKNNSTTGAIQLTNGGAVNRNIKILAGKSNLNTMGVNFFATDIYFTKLFTPMSSPVVTGSMWSANQVSAFNIHGLDGSTSIDHRGFTIVGRKLDNDVYQSNSFLNWIAIGY
jgi:hypothetical protein